MWVEKDGAGWGLSRGGVVVAKVETAATAPASRRQRPGSRGRVLAQLPAVLAANSACLGLVEEKRGAE